MPYCVLRLLHGACRIRLAVLIDTNMFEEVGGKGVKNRFYNLTIMQEFQFEKSVLYN